MKNKITVLSRSIICGLIIMISSGLLAGCGITYPELTTEEYDQAVEYAAGLLLKYDKNYNNKLIEPEELMQMKPEPEVPVPVAEVPAETAEEAGTDGGDITARNDVVPLPMTELMAIEGVEFKYAGFETVKEYPDEVTPGEVYTVMMASENNVLLVLNFDAVNNSGTDLYLDMLQRGIRFRVGWNGGDMGNTMTTMLLNELSYYRGNLAAGESVRLVVVREIPEGSANGIFSIEMSVREGDVNTPVSLNS